MVRNNFSILVLLILSVMFSSCDDTPKITGSSSFVIGQSITVKLTNGDALTPDSFILIDSAGNKYPQSTPELEYTFNGNNSFSFRIPPLIADGPAVMQIGSKAGPYNLDISIIRGLVYGDGSGLLRMVGIHDLTHTYKSATVEKGNMVIKVIDSHSSILVVSPESGRIDWYSMDSPHPSQFKYYIPVLQISGVNTKPKDVVAFDVYLVIATNVGVSIYKRIGVGEGSDVVLESGILSDVDFTAVAASDADANGDAMFAAVGSLDGNSVLAYFESDQLGAFQPQSNSVILSDTNSDVSSVTVSQDGLRAISVVPSENRLYLVNIKDANPVPIPTAFADCSSPSKVAFVNDSQRIAVLCKDSGTVQLYNVSGTSITHFKTLNIGTSDNKPSSIFHSYDDKIYVSLANGGIYYFDAGSSNPEVSFLKGSDAIITNSFAVQP